MARIPRSAVQGAVVPVTDPGGVTTWQRWTYGELVSHIQRDMVLDSTMFLPDVPYAGVKGAVAFVGRGNAFTGAAGGTAVFQWAPITIHNPAGAQVVVMGSLTGYTSAAGAQVNLYYQVDGGTWLVAQNQVSLFIFNAVSTHETLGIGALIPTLAPGQHNIGINSNCPVGSWNRDTNDFVQALIWEV